MTYSVSDHFGLAEAINEVSTFHFLDLLETAAAYNQAFWLADSDDEALGEQMLDCALMYGYLFRVKLTGWRLFGKEHGFDPEVCWALLPGHASFRHAERLAAHAAFLPEGATAYLKRLGHDDPAPPTAESVAAELRELLKARTEWWG